MVRSIAITGGVGAGKSQVCRLLRNRGYASCDADTLAREILFDPAVQLQLTDAFGASVFVAPGQLDRALLRSIVFADPAKRKILEGITHPAIARMFFEKVKQLGTISADAWFFYEAALIFETNRAADFDAVVVVTAAEAVRTQRLLAYRKLEVEDSKKIMASQMADIEKISMADFVIDNSSGHAELEILVDRLLAGLRQKFSPSTP